MKTHDVPDPDYGAWKVPTLNIRNSANFAQDATIKWGVTPYEVKALIESSPRFKDNILLAEPNRVTFGPTAPTAPTAPPFRHDMQWSASMPLPFITRETPVFIPEDVWQHAALFFIATLSDEPHSKSAPFFFDAQISWNIPEGGRPKRFRVKAFAENAKLPNLSTPKFLAKVNIEVAEAE